MRALSSLRLAYAAPLLLAAAAAPLAVAGGCSAEADLFESQGATTGGATTAVGSGGAGGEATTAEVATTATTASSAEATTGSGGAGGDSTTTGSGGDGGGGGIVDGGLPDAPPPPPVAEVYAHSSSVLYKLDPLTLQVTTIGNFTGCSSVIDIAIDKNGIVFGTTFSGLYTIDKATAACTFISSGAYPNSLSFVPQGTVDPNQEALVGYQGGTYVRVDTVTGAVSTIGSLGQGYSSSGDIVSLIGAGTYLTVTGNGCGDCLVSVDPSTGALISNIGSLAHSGVFGIAYWGGVAYGFSSAGQLFSIDVSNASTANIMIPNAPANLSFWGAGSSTAAPHM